MFVAREVEEERAKFSFSRRSNDRLQAKKAKALALLAFVLNAHFVNLHSLPSKVQTVRTDSRACSPRNAVKTSRSVYAYGIILSSCQQRGATINKKSLGFMQAVRWGGFPLEGAGNRGGGGFILRGSREEVETKIVTEELTIA